MASLESGLSDILDPIDENALTQDKEIALMMHIIDTGYEDQLFNSVEYSADLDINGLNNMVKYEPPFNNIADIPPPVLSNEDYSGPFNFQVSIQSTNTGSKNQWIYSEKLKKIFVTMSTPFPVDFKWDHFQGKRMFVRARPLFSQPQHSQEMVVRCAQHSQEQMNLSLNPSIVKHVLRCQNSSANYEGDADANQHFSVVVPLGVPQSGVDYVRQMYNFVCKNSCPGIGMNRRLIDVVFTLEDEHYQIWGRKAFSVRICSCPKRDKDKEEREIDAKGAKAGCNVSEQTVPQGKKRKLEKKTVPSSTATSQTDKAVVDLNLKIVGKGNAYSVLKYAYDLLAGEVARTGEDKPHKAVMQSISNQMKNFESE